ncbi:hypothetical protein AAG906_013964 [Vitis piasezkii]
MRAELVKRYLILGFLTFTTLIFLWSMLITVVGREGKMEKLITVQMMQKPPSPPPPPPSVPSGPRP